MKSDDRAKSIIADILVNHLPRVKEGLEKGYVDENQILVIYDHAVRARILTEQADDDLSPRTVDWLKGRVKRLEETVATIERDSHPPADLKPAIREEVARVISGQNSHAHPPEGSGAAKGSES